MTYSWLDDAELVRRIFAHIDNQTTDLATTTWREPTANYVSEDRLGAEMDVVLRGQLVPFCPSAAVCTVGAYLAREAAGVPIVAVRGSDGEVRAFKNSCRHRGTSVASGRGCAASFVCPYHGWVYQLDGALRRVPHEYSFPGLDKATRGLVEVPADERGGIVFVQPDAHAAAAPTHDLDWISGDQTFIGSAEFAVDANWKIVLEGFLEGYHIKATHPDSFLPFGYDNLNVVEFLGRDSRVTFPFRRIESLRALPPADWRVDGMVTIVHHVFPNTIVARLSHHTTMVVLEPVTPSLTNLVTYQLTNRTSGEAASSAQRDAAFVAQGAIEDRDISSAVQRGLQTGANEFLEFGRSEGALTHFHRHLDEALTATGRTG